MITIVTTAGTMGRWWDGFPADIARALTDPMMMPRGQMLGPPHGQNWVWRGCEYPSKTFPMRPSILQGWEENVRVINDFAGKFVLSGYSQGAVITAFVWREEILKPGGRLHHRLNDCLGVINYGPPMRCPGIAYGNTLLAKVPAPGKDDGYVTGGIAGPANLRPEECVFPKGHPYEGKAAVYDFANDGDLYGACPVGQTPWEKETEVGHNELLMYEAVMDFNGKDLFAFAKEVFQIVTMPWWQLWPLLQATWNGLRFVQVQGSPHGAYDIWPAILFLDELGRKYA